MGFRKGEGRRIGVGELVIKDSMCVSHIHHRDWQLQHQCLALCKYTMCVQWRNWLPTLSLKKQGTCASTVRSMPGKPCAGQQALADTSPVLCPVMHTHKKKRKEDSKPFDVNLTRSRVTYQAAQLHTHAQHLLLVSINNSIARVSAFHITRGHDK